jgi:hypothetical protein
MFKRPERHNHSRIALLLFCAALVSPQITAAQVLYGSIVGNVKDSTNAAVAEAAVTITNNNTGQTRQALTNHTGVYSFPTVQAGSYQVAVSKEGFTRFVQSNVPVAINSVARVDVELSVGVVAESVTVTAETAIMQADRAEVRAEISNKSLVDLPGALNRNYQLLLNTVPGVSPLYTRDNNPSNATGSSIFNVNGASNQINNTRIEGASTTNIWQPQYVAYTPPIEAIAAVNIVTNSYDAEQGLAGGAAINVELKSGTNEFHGALFHYHHNQHLRARPFFIPTTEPLGKYLLNQYGGTLGGPVKRDKLFFFVSFENSTDRRARDTIASVPTAAVRAGDMSAYPTVYDPLTGKLDGSGRTPFANNQIPGARKDPIVQKIIPLVPMPNLAGESRNYFVSGATITDRWALDNKANWNITDRSSMWGRFSLMDLRYENSTIFGDELIGNVIQGGNTGAGGSNIYNYSAGAVHAFSPTLIMDTNFGYVQHNTGVEHPGVDENTGLDFLGIPGTNGPERFQGGWPRFDLSTYDDYGVVQGYMPYWRWDNQQQMVANFTWTKGAHEIRWGADVYRQAMNHTQPEVAGAGHGARGTFVFGSGPTRLCTSPDGQGGCRTLSTDSPAHSFATFLLGLPTRLGKNLMTINPFTTRQWQYSLYIRDKWQLSPKWTISYGTRWEYYPVPTREDRGLERYDPMTNKILIGGLGAIPKKLGVNVSRTLFAPRLGIAYRATNTLVVRAGYGISIDPYSMARSMRTNHPVIIELDKNTVNSWLPAQTLAEGIPPIEVPELGDGIVDIPLNVSASTMPDEFRRGYIQSWNFTVQKELPSGFAAEVGYVATRQIRQLGFQQLNWAPIGAGQAGQQLFKAFGRTATTRIGGPVGGSHFDSMQARLQRRFSRGFALQVAYTWGKSITNAGEDNSDGTLDINIPEYYGLNRRVSSFDRTHNLSISQITELPFGKGKPFANTGRVLPAIVGGWQVNGVVSFYSGSPFTVTSSGTSLNAPGNAQTADQIKPNVAKLGGIGPDQAFFDPLAFAPVTERRFGTAGFNILRGPGVANWDFGVVRHFPITERWNLEFRMDSFNFTNTPHFNNPGANVSSLRLNPDGTVRDLNGFSEVLSAFGERQFRLGLRMSF